MKRSDGEQVRLEHSIKRMRNAVDSLELNVRLSGPASETAAALVQTALEVAMQVAKLDAFELAERDDKARASGRCPGCHWPTTSGHGSPEGVLCSFAEKSDKPCTRPPKGWYCTRGEHADGPCAALSDTNHCNRADGSSPVGVCGGDHHTCSCECSACSPPD